MIQSDKNKILGLFRLTFALRVPKNAGFSPPKSKLPYEEIRVRIFSVKQTHRKHSHNFTRTGW